LCLNLYSFGSIFGANFASVFYRKASDGAFFFHVL
jgi:hypothetical protein